MTTLVLNGIVFRDFEIPARINFGGEHRVHRHINLGGGRVLDKMGPTPDDIRWQGIFKGTDAVTRARAIERLYITGQESVLAWGTFVQTVIVHEFKAEFERFYQIPYQVSCIPVATPGAAADAVKTLGTLDKVLSTDLAIVNQLVS